LAAEVVAFVGVVARAAAEGGWEEGGHACGAVGADAADEELAGGAVAEFVDAGAEGGGEDAAGAGVGEGAPGGPGGHGREGNTKLLLGWDWEVLGEGTGCVRV